MTNIQGVGVNFEVEKFEGELRELRKRAENCTCFESTVVNPPTKPVNQVVNRFVNLAGDKSIDEAIKDANKLLDKNSKMMSEIFFKNDFQYDSGSGSSVVLFLTKEVAPVKVNYYTPWNPWSAAIGYSQNDKIFINSRRNLDHLDLVSNLVHEFSHYRGFHHGNNYYNDHKGRFSVPYFLSNGISEGKWL